MKPEQIIKQLEQIIIELGEEFQPKKIREEISKDKITAKSTYKVISSCGHYGSTSCGNCDADLDKLDYKLIPRENGTNQLACPSCEYTFDKKDMIFYF